MIEFIRVAKSFDRTEVLNNVNFSIQPGERVSIVGPGGCGKTVLLKLLLGLEPVTSGTINLLDLDMTAATEKEKLLILKRVGMAFQQGALFDYMNVKDNLFFAMKNMTDFDEDKMARRVDELLQAVKLPHTHKLYPFELSGGMKRRVGIARALATDPQVAIFDEPTSGLDPVTSTVILNMIDELGKTQAKRSLLVATTSIEVAFRFAERIIVMNEKTIIADGNWKELILNGSEWVRNFLSIRLIGLDLAYAKELNLPQEFINEHW